MTGSNEKCLEIIEKVRHYYTQFLGSSDILTALDSCIKEIKNASEIEIAEFEEDMKLAGSSGGFEGTNEEYNETVQANMAGGK